MTPDGLYNDLGTFGFNFLILISVWMRYTRVMSVLPLENRWTSLLNTLLLFDVSIEPFLFNILRSVNGTTPAEAPLLGAATSLYGVDLGGAMLIMGIFTLVVADEDRKLVPKDVIREFRIEAAVWTICAGIFLVSALPVTGSIGLDGQSLRTLLWVSALGVFWVGRVFKRVKAAAPAG
jgi:uncharacterized membrane protein